ncbi:MAG: hypothetical protein LLF76_02905 [Planctomycetaceae bacterium]|nr:hypothetical protein [Planctomycetaceae bacterium]
MISLITNTARKFKSKFRLPHELEDLVGYIYFRQNIDPSAPPGIIKRRAWLDLIEMRQKELDAEAKLEAYKQCKCSNFRFEPDPLLQAVDDRDEAETFLRKLSATMRAIAVLIFYHDAQLQTIAAHRGQSRYSLGRQFNKALQQAGRAYTGGTNAYSKRFIP